MKVKAAVAHKADAPLSIETVDGGIGLNVIQGARRASAVMTY